ncbi:MAG: CPCC family cysteine-rich protein [Myxococcaceae bacterium]
MAWSDACLRHDGVTSPPLGGQEIRPHQLAHWPREGAPMAGADSMSRFFDCPCCGYPTLPEKPPGTFEICPVCFWEDDDLQFRDSSFAGGANRVSLDDARRNFVEYGASERELRSKVRTPTAEEVARRSAASN